MPRPLEYLAQTDPVTADFSYIHWLGDRKAIEELTMVWDKTLVDRSGDLQEWVVACRNFIKRKIRVFAFPGGYAPETLRLFEDLLEERCGDLAEQVVARAAHSKRQRPAPRRRAANFRPLETATITSSVLRTFGRAQSETFDLCSPANGAPVTFPTTD
jgi:hypothetical protein